MMINEGDVSLLRLVPPVLRARDFRLYTQGGGRLVDLWQYGGAALLGHTPSGVLCSLKNTANRGLFAPLPHPEENRLLKALSCLFAPPGEKSGLGFRLYGSAAALRRALNAGGFRVSETAPLPDPALPSALPGPPAPVLWRPFLAEALSTDRLLVPILALPWPDAPRVLALPEPLAPAFPPSEILPPLTLAAAARSVYDLIAAAPARGRVNYPRITAALSNGKWRQRGIYLHYAESLDEESYAGLFNHFLEQGFLLPPGQTQPLILPGILSPGEEAKLAELLGEE